MNARRINQSPWDIGRARYDQRDLYTVNNRTDASGYARGPSRHPELGSYAYVRPWIDDEEPNPAPGEHGPPLEIYHDYYEQEAWPANVFDEQEVAAKEQAAEARASRPHEHHAARAREHEEGLWDRLKDEARGLTERFSPEPRPPSSPAIHAAHTDDEIHSDVREALTWHREIDASDIHVAVAQGVVTLEGSVHDRRTKRLAAEVAVTCEGVVRVRNRLRVRHDDDSDQHVVLAMPLEPV